MDVLSSLQWPAMVVTVVAAWLVGSTRGFKRNWGFWCFLASNVLWVIWGVHDHAYALITLQLCLAVMNIRGARRVAHCRPESSARPGEDACQIA